jgi:hypothetical protein
MSANGKFRALLGVVVVVAIVLLAPAIGFAQSSIAGVARDESGAVLPGVTVEASSSALIEKVRTVVTDEQGVYRIVDLRPGTYLVTFALQGFNTFRREGILLEGGAIVTVNGDMKVGSIEESITVTGEAPIVDTQSTVREQVLNRDLLDAIPTSRQVWTVGYTLPGVTLNGVDVGGAGGIQQERMGIHGANQNETTIEIDGMIVNTNHGNGSTQHYFDDGMVQEMAFQTSANSAETQRGGVRLNMIPQTGGNTFSGTVFTSSVPTEGWQSNNYTEELRRRGLPAPTPVVHLHDYSGQLGGPIKRDKLWFYTSVRHLASNVVTSDSFYSDGSQVVDDDWIIQGAGRVTWQAATQHKLTGYFERSRKFRGHIGGVGVALEAMTRRPALARYYDLAQAKWTGTLSSKLLLETGWSFSGQNWTQECQEGVNEERGTPAWFRKASRQDIILSTRWVACATNSLTRSARQTPSFSVSYVTGSHAFKTGVQWSFGPRQQGRTANGDLNQRYRNGAPDSVIVYNTPNDANVYLSADSGVYAQDSWKRGKTTFNYGLRWDYFASYVPEQSTPGGRFFAAKDFDRIALPSWSDLSPRFGVAYDIFGNGTTALKGGINKYVLSEAADFALQYNPIFNDSDTRRWTDLNLDDIAQDNEIGPSNNAGFGIARSRNPDPNLKRPYNLEYNISLERQLLPGRLSASIGYYRRTYHRLYGQDNLLITPADFTPVTLVSPLNGEQLTVYNLNPLKQGLVDVLDRQDAGRKQTYNGFEATFQVRTPGSGRIVGGLTHDRTRTRDCSLDDPNNPLPTRSPTATTPIGRFCDEFQFALPFRNLFKLTGSYPLPLGIQLSGSYQSSPGRRLDVNYSVGRGIVPNLTQTTVTVPLIAPETKYRKQINQLDFSLAKSINVGGSRRVRLHLDLFNAINSNVILAQFETWGPNLDRVDEIIQGRLIRIGGQFHF